MKTGQVSIKITKPRLTIDGFKMDPEEEGQNDKSERKSAKSRQSKQIRRVKNDSRERTSTSEIQSKGQQSSILNGAKGLDESIPQYSRGRSDGKGNKDGDEPEPGPEYYDDTLDDGHQEDEMDDQMEAGPEDEDGQEQAEEYDDDIYNNFQGSPGAANAALLGVDYGLAPHEKDPRIYAQLPSCFTRRIAPAGKGTYKSESAYNVLFGST